jgi:Carboxypeptidase regulatory-like domain
VKRFKSGCVLLMMLAWACDGGNGSPTSPSTSQVTLLGIRVNGPASVPPGDTAHYTATAQYSDGSSKDVTAAALWSPTYSEYWDPVARAEFALSFMSPGVTAAAIRGERNLFALYEGMRGMLNVLVLEPGTFKLSGVVSDSSGGSLDDVTVEVLSGTGKGLKATTNNIGQYVLYGVAGPVQLRTSADGFHAEMRDVGVTGNGGSEPFALTPVESPADVSGTWTMTVRSSPRCRAGLPDIAQGRTYEVRLTQQGTTLHWRMSSPTLERDVTSGFGNIVLGPRVRLELPGDTDEGEYTSPVLYDRLSPTELFGFTGSAEGAVTGQEIRLALNGSLTYWDQSGRGSFWYCRTTDHVITLRR